MLDILFVPTPLIFLLNFNFFVKMATTVRSRTSASKRQHESEDESDVESGISSDEEIEETPEEKRLRLASIYLEEIQRKG